MKKLFLLVFIFLQAHSDQFVYPLFEVEADSIMLVYQKSLDDVELWLSRKNSGIATKELSSVFTPSQVRPLPGGEGFSFIDRGRVRIKSFAKRAPRLVEMLAPISSVLFMEWVEEDSFIFTGKCFGRYGIFLCKVAVDGSAETLVLALSDKENYLYPSMVNDRLFCVAQDDYDVYHIVQIPWQPRGFKEFDPQRFIPLLISTFSDPTCFLSMKSESEGFFVQYSHRPDDELLLFRYFSLSIMKENCQVKELFEFRLPLSFLTGGSDQRVYDSIYPFLPRFNQSNEEIFFVDFDPDSNTPFLCKHCLKEAKTVRISGGDSLFAPLPSGDAILYAGRIYKNEDCGVIQGLKERGLVDSVLIEGLS